MKALMPVVLVTAAIAALSGCVSLGPQETPRYYVLSAVSAKPDAVSAPRAATLLVVPTVASTFYETQELAYSRARYAEPPTSRTPFASRAPRRLGSTDCSHFTCCGCSW